MGNFYTNITVRTPDQTAVERTLAQLRRRAYVAPPRAGCTTIFDERSEAQDTAILGGLAEALSARLDCAALAALNHDDSVLALALYDRGRLVTEYSSDAPQGVDVAALCRAFEASGARPLVWALLHGPRPLFEMVRHQLLARLLGLPPWVAGSGFTYIAQGEDPSGLTATELALVEPS